MKVAVFGAGAWGTALAGHLAARHDTVLWARDRALVAALGATHENTHYLPGIALPDALRYEDDFASALAHCAAVQQSVAVRPPHRHQGLG